MPPQAAFAQNVGTKIISGDCRTFSFYDRFNFNLSDEGGWTVKFLRDGAPMFSGPKDGSVEQRSKMSQSVNVVQLLSEEENPTDRVQIRTIGTAVSNKYWVNRQDLSCQRDPLIDRTTRLERKALIRTQTALRDGAQVQAVTAFRRPDLTTDDIAQERKLSRFNTYLIYAESEDAYLLGESFNLGDLNERFVGWVSKEDVINWNWSVGLRPPMDIKNEEDGSTGSICGYETPQARSQCVPILGGHSWFRKNLRLPLIAETDSAYKVAVSASGLGNAQVKDGILVLSKDALEDITIDPDSGLAVDEEKIAAFNKIDVFFLIDGTQSMTPYIDAIRGDDRNPGVVRSIVDEIEKRGGGAGIRAGFRVFRDSKATGETGIDQSYVLPSTNCGQISNLEIKQGRNRFELRLRRVQASSDDRDDFSENLLGGLKQAARDMNGCPDRVKFLFVISDADYDPQAQIRRGQRAIGLDEVTRDLLDNEKLITFFIRPPLRPQGDFKSAGSYNKYRASWDNYRNYAMATINRVLEAYSGDNQSTLQPADYFVDLSSAASAPSGMFDAIQNRVNEFARPEIVNEILIDLRGGSALENVIQRLQSTNADVPVLYWNMLRKSACGDDPESCNQRVYDGVFELFIPKAEEHVLDVWMNTGRLISWTNLLNGFARSFESLGEERDAFGQVIRNSLSAVLDLPTPEDLDETLSQFMQRAGYLPGPFKTPLLNYTFAELENAGRVSQCELQILKDWLKASHKMLNFALDHRLSRWNEARGNLNCQPISIKGEAVPRIGGDLERVSVAPDPLPEGVDFEEYKLGRKYRNEQIYWIPHQYLP